MVANGDIIKIINILGFENTGEIFKYYLDEINKQYLKLNEEPFFRLENIIKENILNKVSGHDNNNLGKAVDFWEGLFNNIKGHDGDRDNNGNNIFLKILEKMYKVYLSLVVLELIADNRDFDISTITENLKEPCFFTKDIDYLIIDISGVHQRGTDLAPNSVGLILETEVRFFIRNDNNVEIFAGNDNNNQEIPLNFNSRDALPLTIKMNYSDPIIIWPRFWLENNEGNRSGNTNCRVFWGKRSVLLIPEFNI